jgi:demethylmenaquinone methyltransferase/2-methoxy-6-polyprenyl-1,4-benzoquinol methylase
LHLLRIRFKSFRTKLIYSEDEEKMDAEALGNSKILNLLFKPSGILMGSSLRRLLMNPEKILRGAGIQPSLTVLEVGCGTGFFTIPAAQMIGEHGRVIAMDALSTFIESVSKKVEAAELKNVRVEKRDALDTGLDTASIDKVLLFGVIPYPTLPLKRLLPEMHRVLKPKGTVAVWLFPPRVHFWVPKAIQKSELFKYVNKKNGVHNYNRI